MEIIDEVRQAVAKAVNVPIEDIDPDARLADIGLNSLDMLEVIFELEEKFGIDIPVEFKEKTSGQAGGSKRGDMPFQTIAEVASAVAQHMGAKHMGVKSGS
jgi:acyl carrier protein